MNLQKPLGLLPVFLTCYELYRRINDQFLLVVILFKVSHPLSTLLLDVNLCSVVYIYVSVRLCVFMAFNTKLSFLLIIIFFKAGLCSVPDTCFYKGNGRLIRRSY